jgi:hypothetical protein
MMLQNRQKFDPTKRSLTNLPYEVLIYHVIPSLPDTATVFRFFTTCKLFHQMIGYPTPSNHSNWKLSVSLLAKLRMGTPDGWIHGISYYFTGLFGSLKCQDTNCYDCSYPFVACGTWRWEFRAVFCNRCLAKNTIRYLRILKSLLARNILPIEDWS